MRFDIVAMADYSGAHSESAQKKHIYLTTFIRSEHKVSITSMITRNQLRQKMEHVLVDATTKNQVVLIGLDHNFGFPVGFAKQVVTGHVMGWFEQFNCLTEKRRLVNLGPRNWADLINQKLSIPALREKGPFWGPNFNPSRKPVRMFSKLQMSARRLVEERCHGMKSIFQLGGAGSVGLQSLHGMVQLFKIIEFCRRQNIPVHIWPFDGWNVPQNKHLIIEIYPAIYNAGKKGDMEDSWASMYWFREKLKTDTLSGFFHPRLSPDEKKRALVEGWVPGIL
jgi:hypothetical protein